MRKQLPSDPMSQGLKAVRKGRQSFAEFARATAADWQRMAARMCRRYYVSPQEVEDVEQEMLLEAWLRIFGHAPYDKRKEIKPWDWRRGKTFAEYCRFHGHVRAQRMLRRIKHFELHEVPSEMLEHLGEACHQQRTPLQQLLAERAQVALKAELLSDDLKRCYTALVHARGSIDLATCLLYDDPEARAVCRLGNENEAERAIIRAAELLS